MEQFKWLDRQEYPFQPHYFTVNGHRLHYIDEGKGPVLLFVHGTPSWSFDFRKVIQQLKSDFRCIAIDHIGFGLSDKPEHYDYSTINHGLTLERFIDALDLADITLVMHDFGGPIGCYTAIRQPQKIKKLVVLNSWMWSSVQDPAFQQLRNVLRSPLLPFLYRYLNFSPRFLMPRSFGDHPMSSKIHRQFTRPFASPGQRNGALAFARSLLNDQEWFEWLWDNKGAIDQQPVLLVWGMKDPIIKPYYLEKFTQGFPNAQVVQLEQCGHFPQEEQPNAVSEAIYNFMVGK